MVEKFIKTIHAFLRILKKNTGVSLSNKITIEDIKSIVNIISTSHMMRFRKNIVTMVVISLLPENSDLRVNIVPCRLLLAKLL